METNMKNNSIYELNISLNDIDLAQSAYKLTVADLIKFLANDLVGETGYLKDKPVLTKEQIEEKVYRKGFNDELKQIGIKINMSNMSQNEQHDYLKLLCFLMRNSFIAEDIKFRSVIVQAKNMKFSINDDEDSTAAYHKFLKILEELQEGIRNQSSKSKFSSADEFFEQMHSILEFQYAIKNIEKLAVNRIQYDCKEIVTLSEDYLSGIVDNHNINNEYFKDYTIMERIYIFFVFQIVRAIFDNKKNAIEKIRNFDNNYKKSKIPYNVTNYYQDVYMSYKNPKSKDFDDYKGNCQKFFDDNIDNLAAFMYAIDRSDNVEKLKKKINKQKDLIINMVLLSVEQVNHNFSGECKLSFLFPTTYLMLTTFHREDADEKIVHIKQKEDDTKYSNRITYYLKEYKPFEFAPSYAEVISNMLFYGHAFLTDTLETEKECWELEIYLSDIVINICENLDISLMQELTYGIYKI